MTIGRFFRRCGLSISGLAFVALAYPALADCSLSGAAQTGKSVSNQCKACHVFEADKPSRNTGPNLHDVFGAVAGSRADFKNYSEGMAGANAKKLVWSEDSLDAYISDPAKFLDTVNGRDVSHHMFFRMSDAARRQAVIAFLKEIKGRADCN